MPSTTYLAVVSSRRPIGPRACSFWVEMPISAPKPNSSPSTKRVDAFDDHRRGVDLGGEAPSRVEGPGHDGLAVAGAEPVHVVDGLVERVDDPHGQLQVEELGRVGLVVGHTRAGDEGAGRLVTEDLDLVDGHGQHGEEVGGDRAVHQQRLDRVAHSRALHLGVADDVDGHLEVGRLVDVHVAVAVPVDDIGHGGVLEDRADQRRPAPRDEAVDRTAQAHELDRRLVARVGHELDRVDGQALLGHRFPQHTGDHQVRAQGTRRPPQERGVSRLEAEARRVARHVGPVLVDDGDDAERHADATDAQSVRSGPPVEHLADRVGQIGDLPQSVGHLRHLALGQRQPVEGGGGRTRLGGQLHVDRVGLEQVVGPGPEELGGQDQRIVLLRRGRRAQMDRGRLRPPAELGHRDGCGLVRLAHVTKATGDPPGWRAGAPRARR